jgi:hypothetical protein
MGTMGINSKLRLLEWNGITLDLSIIATGAGVDGIGKPRVASGQ